MPGIAHRDPRVQSAGAPAGSLAAVEASPSEEPSGSGQEDGAIAAGVGSLRAVATIESGRLVGDVQRTLAGEVHRTWILSAVAKLVAEQGLESVTVRQIVTSASVSRRRFYELFENCEDCFRAVFEDAVLHAAERVSAVYEPGQAWADRLRAGLTALLTFFDSEPELTRVCVLHATPATPATTARRSEILTRLAELVDEGRLEAPDVALDPPPLTAEGITGGALGLVQARLLESNPRPLVTLVNPIMSLIVLPYRGHAAARRELSRTVANPIGPPESAPEPLRRLDMRLTYRTLRVLAEIAAAPGISNRGVAEAAGVRDPGQISKLLARIERLGLIRNTGAGQTKGASNAWILTARGAELDRAVGSELRATVADGRHSA